MTNVNTLGDDLPREMARVRDEVIPAYAAIGSATTFALVLMRHDLDKAAKALAEGDVVAMIACHEALKGFHV